MVLRSFVVQMRVKNESGHVQLMADQSYIFTA